MFVLSKEQKQLKRGYPKTCPVHEKDNADCFRVCRGKEPEVRRGHEKLGLTNRRPCSSFGVKRCENPSRLLETLRWCYRGLSRVRFSWPEMKPGCGILERGAHWNSWRDPLAEFFPAPNPTV